MSSRLRRRDNISSQPNNKNTYNLFLIEELYILCSIRKYQYKICDPLCVSLRVCLLAELAIMGYITMVDGVIVVIDKGLFCGDGEIDRIYNKVLSFFRKRDNVKSWIKYLNGESIKSYNGYHIKRLRKKIKDSLMVKNMLISYESRKFSIKSKIVVKEEVVKRLLEKLMVYLDNYKNNENDRRSMVLAVCLYYVTGYYIIGNYDSRFGCKYVEIIKEICKKVDKEIIRDGEEGLIYQLLKTLINSN
ncbi:hypothetical protein SLOPH_2298 [Spraguea lophii 42_110]|uniref:Golgi phosphoprotein 3 n=1 Tax=Spraguea lophii (strain 42_110) TaxID=1358809 RepID=S7WA90_SPRLO|nr:hypothetical protein SLOPH_2298 [Spraguea lophii 42_110]